MNKKQFLSLLFPFDFKFCSTLDEIEGEKLQNIVWTCNGLTPLLGDLCLNTVESSDAYPINSCRPILRPLCDIKREIEHNGEKFIPSVTLRLSYPAEMIGLNPATWSFRVILKLIEWKFDIAKLIISGDTINFHDLSDFSF